MLFHCRLTPHQETEKSLVELMFGKNLNSGLNVMFPKTETSGRNDEIR